MSDAALINEQVLIKRQDRHSYFEQQVFAFSPFGILVTATLLFALFAGSFVLVSAIDGKVALSLARNGLTIAGQARDAFTLSLLIAVALGLQRYSRVKDCEELAEFRARRQNRAVVPADFAPMSPTPRSVLSATVIGIIFGAVATFTILPTARGSMETGVFAWYLVTNSFVAALFARGIALTRAGGRLSRDFIDRELSIDLLRIEQLNMIGRLAARGALIWFAVSAVLCLFFIGGQMTTVALTFVIGGLAFGVGHFVATMQHMHHRIHAAKSAELERIRARIDAVRHEAHADAGAAQRLQGLIAYETRISATPEWPFDQPTALRVAASALILTVPWFGQAIAGTVVDRIGQVMH
jgi:hypothetical protein